MAHNHNHVTKVYSYVIEEVIKNVREPFLNDGVDEQVLQELKQIWQSKISQSRAVETNEPKPRVLYQQQLTTQRQVTQQPAATSVPAAITLPTTITIPSTATFSAPQTQQYLPAGAQFIAPHYTQIILPQGVGASVQHFISNEGPKGNPPPLRPAYHGIATIQPTRTQQPLQAAVTQRQGATTQQLTARPSVIRGFQIDGPNDSDSDEDDDDDDFNGFGDLDNDDAEDKPVEDAEDPLNSEDDESDEQDPSDLFDTDNVVVCQFDRITRSKNKWKFHLKDGIMNLNGKDYVFQKANGEAEW